MSDTSNDELRLRATEAQMRRALGLNDQPSTPGHAAPTASSGASLAQPQRRRFVRDSDVAATVVHRDHDEGAGRNKLDVARQALSEQTAARERAEHLLQEALATIHDLQTQLAHERLARGEAVQRADSEKQVVGQALRSVREELAAERDGRRSAEQERDDAIAGRQAAEERTREVLAAKDARSSVVSETKPEIEPTDSSDKQKQARPRGRPAKSDQSEAEFVEWWKPGWRDRFR
jgi:hypothetical protein